MKLKLWMKILIACIVCLASFGIINLCKYFPELDNEEFGFNKWDINAEVFNDGSMKVEEELHFFNESSEILHVSESKFNFSKKGSKTIIGNDDESSLREGSFKCSVYTSNKVYIENQEEPVRNSNFIYGYSWSESTCYDERGYPIKKEDGYDKTCIYIGSGLPHKGLVIKYSYIIDNVISKYDDYSILNWKFAGAYSDADTKNVTVNVKFPSEASAFGDNISNKEFLDNGITTMGFGTDNASYTKLTSTEITCFSSKLRYQSNDEIEILTSFDNSTYDIFPDIPSNSVTSNKGIDKIKGIINNALEEENKYYNLHNKVEATWIVIGVILTLGISALLVYFYFKYDKERKPTFLDEYYREIPSSCGPASMVYLYKEQDLSKDALNSQIMDLIRKNYISIDTNNSLLTEEKPNYIMIKEDKDQNGLLESEKFLLHWLFDVVAKGENRLSFNDMESFVKKAKNAEKYNSCNQKWNKLVEKESTKYNWFDKITRPASYESLMVLTIIASIVGAYFTVKFFLSIAVILFLSLIIGLSIFGILYLPYIKRKSQNGIDEYMKWNAFKKFLKDFSTFEDYPIPSLIVWEEYMVYATAFGIADLVEKQLRMKYKAMHREAEFNSYPIFYYHYYHHVCFRMNTCHTIGMKTIAEAKASQMSKSSGRSGGFGGGSSFGGGGRGGSFR